MIDQELLVARSRIVSAVFAEIRRAEKIHPGWPTDLAHQILIVSEEMGEAQQAALNIIEMMERGAIPGPRDEVHRHLDAEMIQVAAMALRFLFNRVGPDE